MVDAQSAIRYSMKCWHSPAILKCYVFHVCGIKEMGLLAIKAIEQSFRLHIWRAKHSSIQLRIAIRHGSAMGPRRGHYTAAGSVQSLFAERYARQRRMEVRRYHICVLHCRHHGTHEPGRRRARWNSPGYAFIAGQLRNDHW